MAQARKRGRRNVLRGYRTYIVCGFVRPARPQRFLWLPAALVAVVLYSAFAVLHRIEPPRDLQRELPLASVARYTAEDFFTSAR